jgi:pimeloyl-ACP methyl ester carboxylesterase
MAAAPDTILFIHGLWMTPRSWEHWRERFESRGYKTIAPSWPGLEVEVEALNRDPEPLARLDMLEVVDHYERIIRGLDRPPLIVGHSIGGTITQVLLDRGLGAAAVGIAPGTVKGVRDLPLTTLRASFPVLWNPFNLQRAVPINRKQFHYAFMNTATREESDAVHERYAVPAAAKVLSRIALASVQRDSPTAVDFTRDDRAPFLSIAFENDHIVPPKAARHNVEKYTSKATTEFKEFPGRPHFPGAPGWEEVADFAIAWVQEHAPGGTGDTPIAVDVQVSEESRDRAT